MYCPALLCDSKPPSSASIVFKRSVHFLCDCVARPVFAACFLNCFVFRGSGKCRVKPPEYCPVWKSVFCVVCWTHWKAVKRLTVHWWMDGPLSNWSHKSQRMCFDIAVCSYISWVIQPLQEYFFHSAVSQSMLGFVFLDWMDPPKTQAWIERLFSPLWIPSGWLIYKETFVNERTHLVSVQPPDPITL